MNYYPHHIGDFRSGTVNMSRQSRWIYRDMLDVYYDSESPLSLDLDVLCDEIGVESDDERKIVERLLRFKFVVTSEGYRHDRCDDEIANYHAKADTAKANGKLGGRPRKANQNPKEPSGFLSGSNPVAIGNPVATGSEANQEPLTKNQEPDLGAKAPSSPAKLPTCPTQTVIELFHEILPDLPAVRLLSDKRKRNIAGLWKFVLTSKKSDGLPRATDATEALTWIRQFFERAGSNDFLMGRGQRSAEHAGWQCDIDFLLSEKGMKHVIEKTRETA